MLDADSASNNIQFKIQLKKSLTYYTIIISFYVNFVKALSENFSIKKREISFSLFLLFIIQIFIDILCHTKHFFFC